MFIGRRMLDQFKGQLRETFSDRFDYVLKQSKSGRLLRLQIDILCYKYDVTITRNKGDVNLIVKLEECWRE